MTKHEVQQIAEALRAAADRIERGDLSVDHGRLEWLSVDYDGVEHHDTPDEAQSHAQAMVEPEGGEYHPDVAQVSWGVYVGVEAAHVRVMPADHDYGGGTAAEHGYTHWQEVSLLDVWPCDKPTKCAATPSVAPATSGVAELMRAGRALAVLAEERLGDCAVPGRCLGCPGCERDRALTAWARANWRIRFPSDANDPYDLRAEGAASERRRLAGLLDALIERAREGERRLSAYGDDEGAGDMRVRAEATESARAFLFGAP